MSWDTSPYTGLFVCYTDFKKRKYSFYSPIPSMQCCADVWTTYRKQQTPQLWMEGQGRGVDFFVLWSYPIWVQCLNNNILSPIVGWKLHWLNMRTDFTYNNNLILPLVTSAIFFSKSCKNIKWLYKIPITVCKPFLPLLTSFFFLFSLHSSLPSFFSFLC